MYCPFNTIFRNVELLEIYTCTVPLIPYLEIKFFLLIKKNVLKVNEPLYDQVCAEDEDEEVEDEYDNHLLYQTSKPGYYSEPYLGGMVGSFGTSREIESLSKTLIF